MLHLKNFLVEESMRMRPRHSEDTASYAALVDSSQDLYVFFAADHDQQRYFQRQ